jgi:predicted amidohydrolase
MRLTAIEIPASFDRARDNLALVDRLLGERATDVVVLPEASLTGYVSPEGDFDLTRFAEPRDGPTARALSALAVEHRTHLFGPLIEREGNAVYNTCIGFDREGREIVRYRKRHPWYPEAWATPGNEPHPAVEVEGVRMTLAICFDLHFIEAELPPAQVLLFPSAWVEELDTRPTRLPEIARRHRLAIVNANWGVGEPRVAGQGGSAIFDAAGLVLATGAARIDAELSA